MLEELWVRPLPLPAQVLRDRWGALQGANMAKRFARFAAIADETTLEPWPDVIQTPARRVPDAGQTCQTSSRRVPDTARRPKCPYHARTTSRDVQASSQTPRRAKRPDVLDLGKTKFPHHNAQMVCCTYIDCWVMSHLYVCE
jgi:hypothetical protein